MLKKISLLSIISVFLIVSQLRADEGMWLLHLLEKNNYKDMQKMGLKLTADDIYSINKSSLKDAIIQFGRGCTGEMISPEGLLLTNHHCGYSQIQSHSSVENDYLKHGFWAQTKEEELPNEGLTARFLVRIEDVTQSILSVLNDTMSETERNNKIKEQTQKIEKEAIAGTHYEARVSSFFEGNEFYLMVYEVFKDVRFVGAPPSSIGKFGADTDNWMWPRHTGDFSLFRVYMSPDGKPASYSKENIPYKPKHFLPISLKGVEKGDFSMIMGYPGRTSRYMSSFGIKQAIEETNPTIVKIREEKLKIMREDMDKSDAIRIQYATKYAQTSNYWKYFIGQTRGLKRLKVYDKKVALEQSFGNWLKSNPQAYKKYSDVLESLQKSYELLSKYNLSRWYFIEAVARGAEVISLSASYESLLTELKVKPQKPESIDKITQNLKKSLSVFFKDYNMETDKKIFLSMLDMYYNNVPKEQHPEIYNTINKKYKGNFKAYTDYVYNKSVFVNKERLEKFLSNPSSKVLEKDPVYVHMKSFYSKYREIMSKMQSGNDLLAKANRYFVAGLREMQPEKVLAPDANSTMRFTYGQVLDYKASDAVNYNFYTTIEGIMEKEDPSNWEFEVPEKLKTLYKNKDYDRYANEKGELIVCFISNNDITGGNSGSPVLNADGHLIGLAFDGNWEAMSGDIAFEPALQRTISVDIRYILFIIHKYAGATSLINEMMIVE